MRSQQKKNTKYLQKITEFLQTKIYPKKIANKNTENVADIKYACFNDFNMFCGIHARTQYTLKQLL